jgi:hypothetical protein
MARRPGRERSGEDPHPEPGTGREGGWNESADRRDSRNESPHSPDGDRRFGAVCRALGWLGRNVLLGWATGTSAPLPPLHPGGDGVFRVLGGGVPDPADLLSVRPEPPGAPAPRAPRDPGAHRPGSYDPPPGHPERPAGAIPPSSVERALWRALDPPG